MQEARAPAQVQQTLQSSLLQLRAGPVLAWTSDGNSNSSGGSSSFACVR